jgi:trans-2,3-dihydro-3-hydroxyanthranilate isomerase
MRRFATLDVFTDRRFAGNPLAVVLDAAGLETAAMLAIAREFNLSETVFVLPPEDPSHRARLRIFTPARELPFAGHPTVGTAVLLSIVDDHRGPAELVLEEQVGAVRCRFRPATADAGHAEFDVPRLPSRETGASADDRNAMAQALGLAPNDLGIDGWPLEPWSAGNPFTFVPLASLDAATRCRVDLATFDDAFRGTDRAAAFVFSRGSAESGRDFHARMFAPSFGMIEDPATGSAVAAFAGYLAAHGHYSDGEHLVRVEQGVEMGRPSLMDLRMTMSGGKLVRASIGGQAVRVCEGTLRD